MGGINEKMDASGVTSSSPAGRHESKMVVQQVGLDWA